MAVKMSGQAVHGGVLWNAGACSRFTKRRQVAALQSASRSTAGGLASSLLLIYKQVAIHMTELIWDGKYKDGKKQGPVRIALPFQTIETVNESAQERQRSLELFAQGRETEWRNRLIWGDKKYVLPSLLAEFAGKVNLIYIDPPFDRREFFLHRHHPRPSRHARRRNSVLYQRTVYR